MTHVMVTLCINLVRLSHCEDPAFRKRNLPTPHLHVVRLFITKRSKFYVDTVPKPLIKATETLRFPFFFFFGFQQDMSLL